jgi:hypothetical protein
MQQFKKKKVQAWFERVPCGHCMSSSL